MKVGGAIPGSIDSLQAEVKVALRTYVAELREFIILHADRHRNYYVQAVGREDQDGIVLWCEAVSDAFLERVDRMSPAQRDSLRSLGWGAPGSERFQTPNWWREFRISAAADLDPAAYILAATLHDVFHFAGEKLDVELGDPALSLEDLQGSDALRELIVALGSAGTDDADDSLRGN